MTKRATEGVVAEFFGRPDGTPLAESLAYAKGVAAKLASERDEARAELAELRRAMQVALGQRR